MSLDVNRIVDVQISVSPLALQRAGFGIMNIVGTAPAIPISERIRSYNSITDVAEDFPATSEEYKSALLFFNQIPRPTTLYISRRANYNVYSRILCSGTEQDPATWAAISDGEFSVTTEDGGVQNITGIDFSSVTSMSEVLTAINLELLSVTDLSIETPARLYPDYFDDDNFFLSDNVSGSNFTSYIGAVDGGSGTNISSLMGGEALDGATISLGVPAETITESLNAIEAVNSKWYGYSFTKEVRDDSVTSAGTNADCLDAAAWAEPRVKTFWNNSSDANTLLSTDTTNISYQLEQLGYSRTVTVYNAGDYPAVSAFARGATVDFGGTDTTITYKFKQMPGIVPTDLSASQADACIGFNCNYYAEFGTQLSGDSVAMLAEGVVANGRFIDEVVGLDWLQNAAQTDIFNYLYQSTTKVPQTDAGVAGISQVLEGVLTQAVNNGLAAPGNVVIDDQDVFLPKGYEIFAGLVEDQSQADREARKAPPISFILKGAGAIHSVTVTGTFVR